MRHVVGRRHGHDHARMLLRKTVDDRGQQPARDRLGRSDPYLAGRRIGEVLDILDALSQFLECAQASGKINGSGAEVEAMFEAGEVERIAAYCECDVLKPLRHLPAMAAGYRANERRGVQAQSESVRRVSVR